MAPRRAPPPAGRSTAARRRSGRAAPSCPAWTADAAPGWRRPPRPDAPHRCTPRPRAHAGEARDGVAPLSQLGLVGEQAEAGHVQAEVGEAHCVRRPGLRHHRQEERDGGERRVRPPHRIGGCLAGGVDIDQLQIAFLELARRQEGVDERRFQRTGGIGDLLAFQLRGPLMPASAGTNSPMSLCLANTATALTGMPFHGRSWPRPAPRVPGRSCRRRRRSAPSSPNRCRPPATRPGRPGGTSPSAAPDGRRRARPRASSPAAPAGLQGLRPGGRAQRDSGQANKALRQFRAITANMIFPVMCRRRTPPAPLPAQPPRPNHRLMRAHSTLKNMAVGLKLAWTGASPAAAAAAAGR